MVSGNTLRLGILCNHCLHCCPGGDDPLLVWRQANLLAFDQRYHYRPGSIVDLLSHPSVVARSANALDLPIAHIPGPIDEYKVGTVGVGSRAKGSERLHGSRHKATRPVRIEVFPRECTFGRPRRLHAAKNTLGRLLPRSGSMGI
jgi:hypothetical protein